MSFDILTFGGTRAGTFDQLIAPSLAGDLEWILDFQSDRVSLFATYAADFDYNGVVDQLDLAAWQNGYGIFQATHGQGDANRNGIVDKADFLTWQRQFGLGTNLAQQHAVPEPTSLSLLVFCAIVISAFASL